MKVAYLGPNGTFSEEAAFQYFHAGDVDFHLCETIPDVIEAVGVGKADKGIVPLENTLEGPIRMTVDGLVTFNDLYITGEYILPVSLHLLVNDGTIRSDIKEVWSISPIITQCRTYIKNLNVRGITFDSSASAAARLKETGRNDAAAIGSASLASLLNLHILEENIQDNPNNQTRFIVISREKRTDEGMKKAMFVITPGKEHPGVLSSILNVFAALSINLSWVESRPTTTKLGVYRFFLECDNCCDELTVSKAVSILETLGHEVRLLGRYQ